MRINLEPTELMQSERARLERAVVEAAKHDRRSGVSGDGSNADIDRAIETRRDLNAAIDALLEFEATILAQRDET